MKYRIKNKTEQLIEKWNLREDYLNKSAGFPSLENILGNKQLSPDTIDDIDLNDDEVYGEVQPFRIIELLPEKLVDYFLESDFILEYSNGSRGRSFTPECNHSEFKHTKEMIYFIGEALWHNLSKGNDLRAEYAELIGAFSEEYLVNPVLY
ncbi:hypothetical protein GF361_05145, partial [Candidatus Woesearchaeota archaeon]|nr:hypothetical protein [Candidatus Woesearchaeota archaeon]